MHPRIVALLPFLQWWPRVNRVTVRADVFAGATGALVVLPQGVAFAAIAGMPPEYGIYAAIVPTISMTMNAIVRPLVLPLLPPP